MPWTKKSVDHTCDLPNPLMVQVDEAGVGSIWKCPNCETHWSVIGIERSRRDGRTIRRVNWSKHH